MNSQQTTPAAAGGAPAGAAGAFQMFKNMSIKAGTYIKEGATRTAETVKEGTRNINMSKFGTAAGETVSNLGKQAAEGSSYVYAMTRSTAQGVVGRLAGSSLVSECSREARDAPCPRMLLLCCTALCSGALASEGLFTTIVDDEATAHLYQDLMAAHCAKLLPPSATPQLISSVIKCWLCSLPEPLLTFKLVPALTSADTPKDALRMVLAELPPVNKHALFVLLDTCYRIASNAAINDTDANTLAVTLAPYLLWHEGDPNKQAVHAPDSPKFRAAGEPLTGDDVAVFARLLSCMISNYRTLV